MAFRRFQGKTKVIYRPMTPSTAIAQGDVASFSSGKLIPATSATTALSHKGICRKTIASTDADYALDKLIPIEVPVEKNVFWRGPVTSGLVATDVGLEVDLTNAGTINRAASTVDVALVEEVISSTEGVFLFRFNGSY